MSLKRITFFQLCFILETDSSDFSGMILYALSVSESVFVWKRDRLKTTIVVVAIFGCLHYIVFCCLNSDSLNNHIDRKRTQLSQLQRQLSELETNVHELKSQKVGLVLRSVYLFS